MRAASFRNQLKVVPAGDMLFPYPPALRCGFCGSLELNPTLFSNFPEPARWHPNHKRACLIGAVFDAMDTSQTHVDKTSADKTVVGFDYQYWFFLWKVLQLRTGESVGLEVADDVHTTLANDYQILYQLQHTLKKKADGTPENLTKYDPTFWKTMSNWSKVISDDVAGRGAPASQLTFVAKTDFVLVSNRSQPDPSITKLLADASSSCAAINALRCGTDSQTIKRYMNDVLVLDSTVLEQFINDVLVLDSTVLEQFIKKDIIGTR
jgi:hypothetical protein